VTQCGPRSSLVSHTDSYLHGIVRILPAESIGNDVIESTLRYGRRGCIGSANPNALCHQEFNRHSRRQLLAWLGLPQRAEQWLWNLRCHPTDGACLAAIWRSTWLIWGPFATLIWASKWGGGYATSAQLHLNEDVLILSADSCKSVHKFLLLYISATTSYPEATLTCIPQIPVL